MNPLHIQELLDRCIDFLGASDPCLRACSLVGRSWVRPSQALMFSDIKISDREGTSTDFRGSRLLDTLDASPHLVRCISTLRIEKRIFTSSESYFVRFCNLLFTSLSSLQIDHFNAPVPDPELSAAMKRLLGWPTVRALEFSCSFTDRNHFLSMWQDCSPNITHLSLRFRTWDDREATYTGPGFPARRPIKLNSLKSICIRDIRWWLEDRHCPFDFSCLKALYSFREDMNTLQRVLQHGILAPTLPMAEVLAVSSLKNTDFSALERITDLQLRIFPTDSTGQLSVCPTILTIRPENRMHLRTLRFFLDIWIHFEDQFPNLAVVHISVAMVTPSSTQEARCFFPLLDPSISVQWGLYLILRPPIGSR
ncbi:hypothetical protein B0H17DRAFT_1141569 [Mycena rosella]|uniref:Uncharacterized protein n=1 Tax=Mycena rosella TaxID=1033263 RepID=A0AAD7CZH3_MYCRO|nr:hypothetical protein B0H17DRAFT_1141569 [Mycena rosella]